MSKRINFNAPVNSLSFGFVSYNLLREFFKKNISVDWFPVVGNADFTSFNKATPDFQQWIQSAANDSLKRYNKNNPTLRLWHIGGSHEGVGKDQVLLTFHETDALSSVEVNILNQQKAVIVTSQHSKEVFEQFGVTVPVFYVPLGFDTENFYKTNKKYYPKEVTCWQIAGKAELRKATAETIRAWVKKFGNNNSHVLHLLITNPFFQKPEDNAIYLNQLLEGKKYTNINPLPYLKTLSEVNDVYNAADITIDMSRAEAWSLPSFHTLGLGKHALVHNVTSIKGWANEENAVLIEPTGKMKAFDGMFFRGDPNFNIGNFYNWDEKDLLDGFDKVLERKNQNPINEAGLKIQKDFTWEKTLDKILEIL